MVEPIGQGVPTGAEIIPPEGEQADVQVLLVMFTLPGAPEKVGHISELAVKQKSDVSALKAL